MKIMTNAEYLKFHYPELEIWCYRREGDLGYFSFKDEKVIEFDFEEFVWEDTFFQKDFLENECIRVKK